MHVVWIHAIAFGAGGAERYVRDTAALLAARGVTSTLLYDPNRPTDPAFLRSFGAAFPLVDPERQLAELGADVVYAHRLPRGISVDDLSWSGAPVVRFLHDHALFCLREHKVTLLGGDACTRVVGAGCYARCGGVVAHEGHVLPTLVRLGSLRRDLRRHHELDAVIVGSRYLRNHAIAHGLRAQRVHRVPLYAAPADHVALEQRHRDRLVFAGQLIAGKGLDVLLRALAMTTASLDVLGEGADRAELEAMARRLGLHDRVRFVGAVPGTAVSRYLARARAVVVPSRVPETFGLSGLEAFATGAPLIASAVGGVGEYLVDGQTGLAVPAGQPRALASAIKRILGDDALAARLGHAGHLAHRDRFLPAHHVEALLQVLGGIATIRKVA